MIKGKQVVVTAASGPNAGRLDSTFTSFAQNPFLELHAFIVDHRLPERQLPGITYHLVKPDPSFSNPMRDMCYRRWIFLDELDAEYALVVDNSDVLCLRPMPPIPVLLRGAAVAASVEHDGGRYIAGQQYVSCYLNCGVSFWDVPASREIRREIVQRGRSRFRNLDDQLSLNEVILTRYFDQLVILPSQYNYRAYVGRKQRGWPTVKSLDGVVIYHNANCWREARTLLPVKPRAELRALDPDPSPLTLKQQAIRRFQQRLEPHFVTRSNFSDLVDIRNGGLGKSLRAILGKTQSNPPASKP